MTVTTVEQGYLETPYLEEEYMTGQARGVAAFQFQAEIVDKPNVSALQFDGDIQDFPAANALQFEGSIVDFKDLNALQFEGNIDTNVFNALQFDGSIVDFKDLNALQFEGNIDTNVFNALQFEGNIDTNVFKALQFEGQIQDFGNNNALQFEGQIQDWTTPNALQFEGNVTGALLSALQFEGFINDFTAPSALQFDPLLSNNPGVYATEFLWNNFKHVNCSEGYLGDAYLSTPYLSRFICAVGAMQFEGLSNIRSINALQFEGQIADKTNISALQYEGNIVDKTLVSALQFEGFINDFKGTNALQFEGQINEFTKAMALQGLGEISLDTPYALQFLAQVTQSYALQFLSALYNTTNLRILCGPFPSRGNINQQPGTPNAWGNDIGYGLNWTASSTETGDFSPANLNTDIVEQVWRTQDGDITTIRVDCDTEISQGVPLDTLAILNHNFSQAATITMIGSNTDDFSVIGFQQNLQVTPENIYYIAPALPSTGYRYWRFEITDSSNNDNFLSIGTIIFGASQVFQGECFVDELDFQLRDFADKVETEGFTNIMNSRSQKRNLRLDFRFLNLLKSNFQLMRTLFTTDRTVLKCLWIPTPNVTDQSVTGRFAVFAKLSSIPVERHLSKGPEADYVTFTIDLDESN